MACLGVLRKSFIVSLRTGTVYILFKTVSAYYHLTVGEMNGDSKLHFPLTERTLDFNVTCINL